ncbi:MAG: F0F1 ATP synthase subunit B [Sphingopyxis sp.]
MVDSIVLTAGSAHVAAEHAEPSFIFGAVGWVAVAMALLIAIMIWKKVPTILAAMLDGKIAEIRKQLDEASALRAEAEALRGEYQAKLTALDQDIANIRAGAEAEAALLVANAKDDVKTLIARRKKMAEDRIAAAERSAISDVRDSVVRAAVGAAQSLIAENHGATADKPLIEAAIADIAQL